MHGGWARLPRGRAHFLPKIQAIGYRAAHRVELAAKSPYSINSNTFLNATDNRFNPLHEPGLIGFRTWHTELWWDDVVITRL